MSVGVVGLVLLAAVLHASRNAVLRGGSDRLWLVTVMSFASTAAGVPVVLALPLPARGSWPYLGFSAAVQVLYAVFRSSCAAGAGRSGSPGWPGWCS